ncbi:MAG: hypothetical protein Q4F00_00735 [bacterium]|nr:hypothetical protein [bacterium]
MEEEILSYETASLFNRSFEEEITDAEETALLDRANALINTFGWKKVFNSWNNYLHHQCLTPESAINFANWFWFYGGHEHPIPNPYHFIAYFYYRIDYAIQKYDISDILDSLATSILPKAGHREADLYLNPYYMPESDPQIRAEVEKLKKQNS